MIFIIVLDIEIVYGFPYKEKPEDTVIYNAAAVLGPEGFIGIYKKIHLYAVDNLWSAKGDEPFMFDTKWGPISLGICYDNYQFPELVRYYVWKGSRLHLNPTFAAEEVPNEGSRYAWKRCYAPHLEYLVLTSSIFIASSNVTGWDGSLYGGGPDYRPGIYKKLFEEIG